MSFAETSQGKIKMPKWQNSAARFQQNNFVTGRALTGLPDLTELPERCPGDRGSLRERERDPSAPQDAE